MSSQLFVMDLDWDTEQDETHLSMAEPESINGKLQLVEYSQHECIVGICIRE